jgi:CHAT domain-containing protein/cytochrome c-type biogenesis protein CcmH/NrfG
MGHSLPTEETVREYLLGRVSDETVLEGLEDMLFTNEEFCSQVALAEDELINDYVFERLNEADEESFRATLTRDPERAFKLELTQALRARALALNQTVADQRPSFFDSLKAFFRQPQYAGAFAVLLIAAVSLVVYFGRKENPDQLAELRSIYQQARPTETRLSEFGYAPLAQLRGAPETAEKNRLRRIEIKLIEAAEEHPSAETHHELGVFYLTQQNYPDAIRELESASKLNGKNARIINDLGAAHFELAKSVPKEKKLEELAQSLEEFSKATELDGNFLEALFNKSLALQELGLPREAKESWKLYLQKDSSSPWADEARKNLQRLESQQTQKTDEQVLSDFLTSYRSHDDSRAQKIHNETKGLLRGVTVPLQLSRRYLLAKQSGHEDEARECIEALTYIGNFEQTQNGDSFFFELANFYANVGANKIEELLQAKKIFPSGQQFIGDDYEKARLEFEKSRDIFAQLGDACEAAIAENWAVQILLDVGKVAEGRARLASTIASAEDKRFNILLPFAYYWLGISEFRQSELSRSQKSLKTALRLAEAGNNTFEIQHAEDALVFYYSELGELEPALAHAGRMLPDRELYYRSVNQFLRDQGTLAKLSLKLKFFSTSLSLSKETLSVVQELWPDRRRVNDSLLHTAYAAAAREDVAAALLYANESLRIALNRDDNAENTKTTADTYLLLAEVKKQTKDYREALTDYDKALELYGRLPEFTVAAYQIHKGRLFCFQQLNQQENFDVELKTVLAMSEDYRSTIREDSSRQAFFENEQVVFDAASANAIKAHDTRGAFAFVEESKARSLLEFVKSEKSIAEVEKDYASIVRPLSLAEIQTRLPEQVQLVQYAVLPDKLAIWVVSKTSFDFVEKPISAAELENKIDAYQALVVGKGSRADLKQTGQNLYELLIPTTIAKDKQLCLVPDKFLHRLAFATLVSQAGKFLLEDYALFYAPSASVLLLATENARRKEQVRNESLLSIGNPDFDREENQNLPDLKAAAAEASTIAASYAKSQELLGAAATKEMFLRSFANVEVIHFAGHFVANRQSPGNSKLLFAGGEIRSSELGAYKLPRAKLVVLSACETAFERFNKSEGAVGIARTLLAMGAPVVVASQWKVDSEPTKDLMIAFHRNRTLNRMTSAEGLRRAQLEMLSRDETKAPFYWAAFALFGGNANY